MSRQAARVTKLVDIETLGVALVTRGANKKRFALAKTEEEMTTVAQLLAQIVQKGEMPVDEESINLMCQEAGLDAQQTELFKAMVKLGSSYKDDPNMQKMIREQLPAVLGMKAPPEKTEPPKAAVDEEPEEPAQKPNEEPEEEPAVAGKEETKQQPGAVVPAKKPEEKMVNKGDETKTDAEKARLEEIQKRAEKVGALEEVIKSQNEAIAKMQEAFEKERDARLLGEWVAKADLDLKFVPGKSVQELGQQFFDLEKKVGRDMANSQFDVMKAAGAALAKSAAFTAPRGQVPGAPGAAAGKDAMSQIVAKSEVVLEKSDILKSDGTSELQRAQAIAKALKLNPQLYVEYVNERPQQGEITLAH